MCLKGKGPPTENGVFQAVACLMLQQACGVGWDCGMQTERHDGIEAVISLLSLGSLQRHK